MKKLLAGLALAALTMMAVPQQASALSLQNPFGVASKHVSESMPAQVEQVRFGGRGRGHFRGFRGGGHRWHAHRGWRVRHAWRPRYFAPRYYAAPRRCRIVMTYYGPRRVCRPVYWL